MPRFKPQEQGYKLIPVCFESQIHPGSFEYAVCHLIDHELDLKPLLQRYKNDATGATAFHPGALLKIILVAYSKGILSSRKIESCCRENILFMALSGDSQPHFTTIADFIAQMSEYIAPLFAQVLVICDREKLIDRSLFAIDGVKLPSNAAKSKSGTRADYQKQLDKMEAKVKVMLERHESADQNPLSEAETHKIERLKNEAQKLREWLNRNPKDREGQRGSVVLSNRTDNESAKMATSKGVIQGYTGVAVADSKHQIVLAAEAHGSGSEQSMLIPVLEAVKDQLREDTKVGADSGYHSKAGLKYMADQNIQGYVPDNGYRKRDERYANQESHYGDKPHPLHDKRPTVEKKTHYKPDDFKMLPDQSGCVCPAGKTLYRNGKQCRINGFEGMKFQGAKQDCVPCDLRTNCLRHPEKTATRQVTFFYGKTAKERDDLAAMREKIDSEEGKAIITQRFATIEPVFGNIRANKKMDRFTLRGKKKVDAQWKLYCLVHNIEKLANNGYGKAA